MANKKKDEITIHSSAAEYLTYVAAAGDNADSIYAMKMKILVDAKMLAQLSDLSLPTINEHIKNYF